MPGEGAGCSPRTEAAEPQQPHPPPRPETAPPSRRQQRKHPQWPRPPEGGKSRPRTPPPARGRPPSQRSHRAALIDPFGSSELRAEGNTTVDIDWNSPPRGTSVEALARPLWSPTPQHSCSATPCPAAHHAPGSPVRSSSSSAGGAQSPPGSPTAPLQGGPRSNITVWLRPDPPSAFRKKVRVAYDDGINQGPKGRLSKPKGDVVAHMEGRHPYECRVALRTPEDPSSGSRLTAFVQLWTDEARSGVDVDLAEVSRGVRVRLRLNVALSQRARTCFARKELTLRQRQQALADEWAALRKQEQALEALEAERTLREEQRNAERELEREEMERYRAAERRREEQQQQLEQAEQQRVRDREAEREREKQAEVGRQRAEREQAKMLQDAERLRKEASVALRRLDVQQLELRAKTAQLEHDREAMRRERDTHQREREAARYYQEQAEAERNQFESKVARMQTQLDQARRDEIAWDQERAELNRQLAACRAENRELTLRLEATEGRNSGESDAEWQRRRAVRERDIELAAKGEFRSGELILTTPCHSPEQVCYYVQASGEGAGVFPRAQVSVHGATSRDTGGAPGEGPQLRHGEITIDLAHGLSPGDALVLRACVMEGEKLLRSDTRQLIGILLTHPDAQRAPRLSRVPKAGAASRYRRPEPPPEDGGGGDDTALSIGTHLKVQLQPASLPAAIAACEHVLRGVALRCSSMDERVTGPRGVTARVSMNGLAVNLCRVVCVVPPLLLAASRAVLRYVEGQGSMPLLYDVQISTPAGDSYPTGAAVPFSPFPHCRCATHIYETACPLSAAGTRLFHPLPPSMITLGGCWIRVRCFRWADDDYLTFSDDSGITVDPDSCAVCVCGVEVGTLRLGRLADGSVSRAISLAGGTEGLGGDDECQREPRHVVAVQMSDAAMPDDVEVLLSSLCFRNDSAAPSSARRQLEISLLAGQSRLAVTSGPTPACLSATKRRKDPRRRDKDIAELAVLPLRAVRAMEVNVVSDDSPTELSFLAEEVVYCYPYSNMAQSLLGAIPRNAVRIFRGARVTDDDTDQFDKGKLSLFIEGKGPAEHLMLEANPPDLRLESTPDGSVLWVAGRHVGLLRPPLSDGSLEIDFSRHQPTIQSVETLLRNVTFSGDPGAECPEGTRELTVELKVGESEPVARRIVIVVKPPHVGLPVELQCARYTEGAEPIGVAVFQPRHDPFPSALVTVTVAENCEPGDILGHKKASAQAAARFTFEPCDPRLVEWPDGFTDFPNVIEAEEVVDSKDEVSAFFLRSSESEIHMLIPGGTAAAEVRDLLRSITYCHTGKDPKQLLKALLVQVYDLTCPQIPATSATAVSIAIQPVDDATEFLNVQTKRIYNAGTDAASPWVLLPDVITHDPDTDEFSGGYLSAEILEGGEEGDVISAMPVHEQVLRAKRTEPYSTLAPEHVSQPGPKPPVEQQHSSSVLVVAHDGTLWRAPSAAAYSRWLSGEDKSAAELLGWVGGRPPPNLPKTAPRGAAAPPYAADGSDLCSTHNWVLAFAPDRLVNPEMLQDAARLMTLTAAAGSGPRKLSVLVRACAATQHPQQAANQEARVVIQIEIRPSWLHRQSAEVRMYTKDNAAVPCFPQTTVTQHADIKALLHEGAGARFALEKGEEGDTLILGTKDREGASPLTVKEQGGTRLLASGKTTIGAVEVDCSGQYIQVSFDKEKSARMDAKALQSLLTHVSFSTPVQKGTLGMRTVALELSEGKRLRAVLRSALCVHPPPKGENPMPLGTELEYVSGSGIRALLAGVQPPKIGAGADDLHPGVQLSVRICCEAEPLHWTETLGLVPGLVADGGAVCVGGAEVSGTCSVLGVTHSPGQMKVDFGRMAPTVIQTVLSNVTYRCDKPGRLRRPIEFILRLPRRCRGADDPGERMYGVKWVQVIPPLLDLSRCLGMVTAVAPDKSVELLPTAAVNLQPKVKSFRGATFVAEVLGDDEFGAAHQRHAPLGAPPESVGPPPPLAALPDFRNPAGSFRGSPGMMGPRLSMVPGSVRVETDTPLLASPRGRRSIMVGSSEDGPAMLLSPTAVSPSITRGSSMRQVRVNPEPQLAFATGKVVMRGGDISVGGVTLGRALGVGTARLTVSMDAKRETSVPHLVQQMAQGLVVQPGAKAMMTTCAVRVQLRDRNGVTCGGVLRISPTLPDFGPALLPMRLH
eukprot:TRINITY_DN20486_c1_g1_i1.p1 TRINITY_DN20486_c1_g1~~TRINITY_DN20486_c1_g1_i1.p1  ORF type:complete len:2194 (+),score=678.19 TRINITY_DN20486_c1_g1_i1:73-6582(+)